MRFSNIAAATALAVLGASVSMAPRADAASIITLVQVGSNVVATGNGSINVTSFTYSGPASESSFLEPSFGAILGGPTASTLADAYIGSFVGPSTFGLGGSLSPDSGSGSLLARSDGGGLILVPAGYVSGTSRGTSTDTWDNATFASLGVTTGTYTWTWDSGATADSFTIQVGTVPEPASLALPGTLSVPVLVQPASTFRKTTEFDHVTHGRRPIKPANDYDIASFREVNMTAATGEACSWRLAPCRGRRCLLSSRVPDVDMVSTRLSSVTSRLAGSAPGRSSNMITVSPFSTTSLGGLKIGPEACVAAGDAGPFEIA
jgi:hypothetical protein